MGNNRSPRTSWGGVALAALGSAHGAKRHLGAAFGGRAEAILLSKTLGKTVFAALRRRASASRPLLQSSTANRADDGQSFCGRRAGQPRPRRWAIMLGGKMSGRRSSSRAFSFNVGGRRLRCWFVVRPWLAFPQRGRASLPGQGSRPRRHRGSGLMLLALPHPARHGSRPADGMAPSVGACCSMPSTGDPILSNRDRGPQSPGPRHSSAWRNRGVHHVRSPYSHFIIHPGLGAGAGSWAANVRPARSILSSKAGRTRGSRKLNRLPGRQPASIA